jgi:hypothetical protein
MYNMFRLFFITIIYLIFETNILYSKILTDSNNTKFLGYEDITQFSKYKLFEIINKNKLNGILNEIEETLKLQYNDTIIAVYDKNNILYNSNYIWKNIRDSIFNVTDPILTNKLSYFSINEGYYWYSNKTDWNSFNYEFTPSNYTSNKLKACYWIWQIYSNEIDSLEFAYLIFSDYRLYEFWSNIYPFSLNYVHFKNDEDINLYRHKIKITKPIFCKIKSYKDNFDFFLEYNLNWLKKVKEFGLKEIRKQGISPLPKGYKWEKFTSVLDAHKIKE